MSRTELRIYDKRSDMPGVLIPLAALIRVIADLDPGLLDGQWQVAPGARGYGEYILELEDAAASAPLTVDGAHLFPVLLEDAQYFEHVRLSRLAEDSIELGVFDSSYLFVRCPRQFARRIKPNFHDTTYQ